MFFGKIENDGIVKCVFIKKMQIEKLNYFENIYQCYLTSPDYRTNLEKGNLGVLDDQTFGGNVPIGRVNRDEVEKVVDYIKESKIAYVN